MPKSPDSEMPFLDHLEELRHRLFWIVGALGIGLILGFVISFNYPEVVGFLTSPITPYLPPGPNGEPGKLVFTTPTGAFKFQMAAALYMGLIVALPVIIYQVWAFLSPGLHRHERRLMVPVLAAGTLLFMAGVALAFKFALPLTLKFLLGVGEQNFNALITVEAYFDIMISLCLAFGAMFELPMVVLALTALGIVTPQLLHRFRSYAIVILLVVCAIVTPPDLFSLSIMFIPVYALYEISVLLSFLLYRRREKRIAATADASE
jgi:sec-independent protein translocase protein TatC